MPGGALWKGYLKLSLVTCAVAIQPAVTDAARIRFHTLNRHTGNRLKRQYVDETSGRRIKDEDVARGYSRGDDNHVVLENEELDAVALESGRTIDVTQFIPTDSIGWIWYDRPHFLVPDGAVAEEAYGVIHKAMRSTGTVGISRLVLYRRERAVMLAPRGLGIVLWTLRYGDEVRTLDDFTSDAGKIEPDREAMKLVSRLIDSRTSDWDPGLLEDTVQDRLKELIESRRKLKSPARPKRAEPAGTGNVVSIIDALKRSIAAEKQKPSRR